jgi:hypothetical protein
MSTHSYSLHSTPLHSTSQCSTPPISYPPYPLFFAMLCSVYCVTHQNIVEYINLHSAVHCKKVLVNNIYPICSQQIIRLH